MSLEDHELVWLDIRVPVPLGISRCLDHLLKSPVPSAQRFWPDINSGLPFVVAFVSFLFSLCDVACFESLFGFSKAVCEVM